MKNISTMLLATLLVTSTWTAQAIMGGNSATYAPKKFTISEQFEGPGLVGLYHQGTKTATIHDPSGANPVNHLFNNVTEHNPANETAVLIGTIEERPVCQEGQMCAMYIMITELFGNLVPNN